ncbi:MAG: hypothetical protein H0W15_05330 [Gemmatimonadales bacterium]|nr:hypothetical protein [Gemmatimonadales bacterium]
MVRSRAIIGMRFIITFAAFVTAGLPHAAPAQAPISQAPASAAGRPLLITEGTFGLRLAGGIDGEAIYDGSPRRNITASVGFVTPVSGRFRLGAIATAGLESEFFLGIGPRLRWDATPTVSVDVTPQYLVGKSGPGPSRLTLDLAVMHKDRVGGSLRFGSFRHFVAGPGFPDPSEFSEIDRTAIFAGLRFGRKPGRAAILASVVALAGVIVVYMIACSNGSGCG